MRRKIKAIITIIVKFFMTKIITHYYSMNCKMLINPNSLVLAIFLLSFRVLLAQVIDSPEGAEYHLGTDSWYVTNTHSGDILRVDAEGQVSLFAYGGGS